MSRPDFFIEIFPVNASQVPALSAYTLEMQPHSPVSAAAIGGKLAYRLNLTFPGSWFYAEGRLLTDSPVSPVQMEISLDLLRNQMPDLYTPVASVDEDPRWQPSPISYAAYFEQTMVRKLRPELQKIVDAMTVTVPNAIVGREYHTQLWVCDGEGALSVSVESYVRYQQGVDELLRAGFVPADLMGKTVMDRTSPTMNAEVVGVAGPLSEHRERLLTLTRREVMQKLLQSATDDEPVLIVRNRETDYHYTASALYLLLSTTNAADWSQFGLHTAQTKQALHLTPERRALMVRAVSDVLKQYGVLGNAYNSRTHPHLFGLLDYMPDVAFGGGRVQPYSTERIAQEFAAHSVFFHNPRFQGAPIKIAVINTLGDAESEASDFIEAMRRELENKYGFAIELIRERKVRVVSDKNIESALRKVEKDAPHIVLAFFKEAPDESNGHHRHLKSITVSKGIAAHVIYQSVMHNVDAMPLVIMGLLAKTGNIPYALAEPLDFTDFVVGVAIVREATKQFDRITAIARIYRNNGALVRYVLHQEEVDTGDAVPLVVMQHLFPEDVLSDQRVLVHYEGPIEAETRLRMGRWATVLRAKLGIVEVMQQQVPRLYSLSGQISAPPWGSVFRLSDFEAFVATTQPTPEATPQPLHLRTHTQDMLKLPIEQAAYSVLVFTLLHYGTLSTPKLPVTVQNTDELRQWTTRGNLPEATQGDVPFWL